MMMGGGRGRGGRIPTGQRPVGEEARINIAQMLDEFRESEDLELTFPPNLDNNQRAVVHGECQKHGFSSKSYGKGDSRCVTVFKSRRQAAAAGLETLPLADASQAALQKLLADYPPSSVEMEMAAAGCGEASVFAKATSVEASARKRKHKAGGVSSGPAAADMTPAHVAAAAAALAARVAAPGHAEMRRIRAALPMAAHRAALLSHVEVSQVVLVAGETGCGKTTQVPQYLCEASWAAGRACHIVCTQPRRVSAMTVAERVASERGEAIGTGSVGYQIRLEAVGGPHNAITFCTYGVLLRRLAQGTGLAGVTHLVLDEVHERDRTADFLLIALREMLPTMPHLRLVLMSATINAPLFATYFGGCPVVDVPGRVHPVVDYYLEDVLAVTAKGGAGGRPPPAPVMPFAAAAVAAAASSPERTAVEFAIGTAFLENTDAAFAALLECTGAGGAGGAALVDVAHPTTGATALMAAAGRGRCADVAALLATGADAGVRSRDGSTARDWALQFGHNGVADQLAAAEADAAAGRHAVGRAAALASYHLAVDPDEVDLTLVERLVIHLCKSAPPLADRGGLLGAVLIFLPGWDEISKLRDALESSPGLAAVARCIVLPLHSRVPTSEQRRVFAPAPPGCRKLVLATNIAETAVTIDDVVYVIDSGRLKEKSYDAYTGVATLQATWISKASERQRRGRAGRCRPGECYRLYSRARASAFADYALPELRRTPLEELVLQVKLLEGGGGLPGGAIGAATFLGRALEPPAPQAVSNALRLLMDVGALAPPERLTPLGRSLAALPLPPRIGKMVLHASLMGCLSPVIAVACTLAYREPFALVTDPTMRRAANEAKAALAATAGGGSDHLAAVAALAGWATAKRAGRERAWCASHHVSGDTLHMLDGMRGQLASELRSLGWPVDSTAADRHAGSPAVVRAVLAAGMYPLAGQIRSTTGDRHGRGGGPRAMLLTARGEKVRVHPGSMASKMPPPPGSTAPPPLVVYDELMRVEASLVARACTLAPPHALLLVAARLDVLPDPLATLAEEEEKEVGMLLDPRSPVEPPMAVLALDGWLRYRVPLSAVAPLCLLRLRLADALAAVVHRPADPLTAEHAAAVSAAVTMFNAESPAVAPTPGAGYPPTARFDGLHMERPGGRGRGRGVPHPPLHHQQQEQPRLQHLQPHRPESARGRGQAPVPPAHDPPRPRPLGQAFIQPPQGHAKRPSSAGVAQGGVVPRGRPGPPAH